MAFTVALPNFSKGEIAPSLYGRIDTNQYNAALKVCRNFIVQKYGGVTFRPGTRVVGKIDDPTKPFRLMPFQFSIDQAYALLFQQGSMRPMASGGFVLEQNTQITGATKANPCVLTVPFHGYAVGERFYISGVAGMTELNGRFVKVTAVGDANHVTIDVNSTTFGTFVSSDGTLNAAPPPAPPPPTPTPPPPPPPPPPETGGGGGDGGDGGGTGPRYCVADETLILLADGTQRQARFLVPGDLVRTRHETTLEWGDYPVDAISFAWEPVFAADGLPRATGDHRFWTEADGWQAMRDVGAPDGKAWVARITVREAHTYVSAGVLSHNIKVGEPF